MADQGRVLVVDDDADVRQMLTRMLTRGGYTTVSASDGRSGLDAVQREGPDLDLVILDVNMPAIDGFEVCRSIKSDPATCLTPVILLTGLHERDDRIRGIRAGADDFISKPPDRDELRARVGSLVRMKRFTDELDSAPAVIESLGLTIEGRDPYTEGHCQRVARLGVAIGRQMNLDEAELTALHRAGFLHDIGKIAVPDAMLLKTGPLTTSERLTMEQHTIVGDRLCGPLRSLKAVRPIIRWHHERLDGTGYPDGLRGDAVPLTAQVLSAADAFDAMTTTRPYQPARPERQAIEELWNDVRRGWRRADVVEALTEALSGLSKGAAA